MSKKPKSLLEFQRMFPDEQACADYLKAARWPKGFICPVCGGYEGRHESNRPLLWGCKACSKQTSITAGTVMHGAKLPLTHWFWAAYLVASHSNGISAFQLWKQLQIGSYKSAWLMLAKLRRSMVDPDRSQLSGIVEVDEAFIPFRTNKDPDGPSQGRSPIGKIIIMVAAERIEYEDKSGVLKSRPGRIRIEPVADTNRATLHGFIRRNIEPGSGVVTDGNSAYKGLSDYYLKQIVASKTDDYYELQNADRVISLLKTLGLGTYHGFRRRYIRRYLDEFVWRFNRRGFRPATFHMLLGLTVHEKTKPSPLPKIRGDTIDDANRVINLPNPKPGQIPNDALSKLKHKGYVSRGFTPPVL